MSHIHDALKRAQREKDTLSLRYGAFVAARGGGRGGLGRGAILGIAGLIFFILLAFLSYSWFDLGNKTDDATRESKDQVPAPAAGSEPAAESEGLYQRAKEFHKKGNLAEAKRFYQEALAKDPGHADALNNLGVIYMYDRDFRSARASFEKAIRLRPGRADPFYNMACLCALNGQIDEGLAYLEKALSLNPAVRNWARKDRDLDHLRKSPRFEKILLPLAPVREGPGPAPRLSKTPALPGDKDGG